VRYQEKWYEKKHSHSVSASLKEELQVRPHEACFTHMYVPWLLGVASEEIAWCEWGGCKALYSLWV